MKYQMSQEPRVFICSKATCAAPPCVFFFFNDTATTEIYTLSLHDALPSCECSRTHACCSRMIWTTSAPARMVAGAPSDRKSTRLNSSHSSISYAVFCLKKKKKKKQIININKNDYSSQYKR